VATAFDGSEPAIGTRFRYSPLEVGRQRTPWGFVTRHRWWQHPSECL